MEPDVVLPIVVVDEEIMIAEMDEVIMIAPAIDPVGEDGILIVVTTVMEMLELILLHLLPAKIPPVRQIIFIRIYIFLNWYFLKVNFTAKCMVMAIMIGITAFITRIVAISNPNSLESPAEGSHKIIFSK